MKFELTAEVREDLGKGASRRLRHAGKIPAIIYGGENEPTSITLEHNKVLQALDHEEFYSSIIDIKLGRKKEKVILRDLQRHPFKPMVQHADFQRIDPKKPLHAIVPLHFVGEDKAPGVKGGGNVSHIITEVEVICLPKDLPDHIDIDVSAVEVNQTIHLSELALPKGVKLAALEKGGDTGVYAIHGQGAATAAAEEGEEGGE